MTGISKLISFTCLSLLLSACANMVPQGENHDARCKEMQHQMMFNGATTDQSLAWKQRSEQGMLQQSYHDEGC